MKIRQIVTTVFLAISVSTINPAWAGKDGGKKDDVFECKGKKCGGLIQAPEIDAALGTLPLALLGGVILLMKERSRSKRKD